MHVFRNEHAVGLDAERITFPDLGETVRQTSQSHTSARVPIPPLEVEIAARRRSAYVAHCAHIEAALLAMGGRWAERLASPAAVSYADQPPGPVPAGPPLHVVLAGGARRGAAGRHDRPGRPRWGTRRGRRRSRTSASSRPRAACSTWTAPSSTAPSASASTVRRRPRRAPVPRGRVSARRPAAGAPVPRAGPGPTATAARSAVWWQERTAEPIPQYGLTAY